MGNRDLLRREFLGLGCAAGGFFVGTAAGATASGQAASTYPWPYRELDVSNVQERAYRDYLQGGCMFAVFEAVAGSVADLLGKPYTDFPFMLSAYGGGGVASWGTLCGTCNGAAMAIALFRQGQPRNALINDVFTWYEATSLPVYVPKSPAKVAPAFAMPASRADSVLCHVSISRWSDTSGFPSFSPERLERCGRLAADVAGHVAAALNEEARGHYAPQRTMSDVASGCLGCHAQGKQAPGEPEALSRMACTSCHKEAHNQKK
jgi:hypothetical protein